MSISNNNRLLSIVTIVLLVANIITLALLWTGNKNPQRMDGPPRGNEVFEFLTKELQLNKQQEQKYSELRDEHQLAHREIREKIRTAKDSLFSLMQHPPVADSVLKAMSERSAGYEAELDVVTFRHFEKLRAICTIEQQKKFDLLIKEVLQRMGGPKGPPPGQGQGLPE